MAAAAATPTPTSALSSGSPAATNVPSMTTSTIPATRTPTASAVPPSEMEPWAISAEKSTVTPCGVEASTAASTASFVASGISCCGSSKATVPTAVEPSVETMRISEAMSSRARPSASWGA